MFDRIKISLLFAVIAVTVGGLLFAWYSVESDRELDAEEKLVEVVPIDPATVQPSSHIDYDEVLLAHRVDTSRADSILDEVVAVFDDPINARPAYSTEYVRRNVELIDLFENSKGHGRMQEAELEEIIAETQDPLAMYHLALRLEKTDTTRALHLYYESALRGTIDSLARSASVLAEIAEADANLEPEIRSAIVEEAYARYTASVMFGYGEFLIRFIGLQRRFGNIPAPERVCASGVALAAEMNAERERMGMRPIPVMFGGREIVQILNNNYGLCS